MTVWTNVTLDELNSWLAKRSFGKAKAITPIEDGVEDSVFRVDFEDGKVVCLRLFERTEPEGPLDIAFRLAAQGLPTCPPILDKENRYLLPLNGKPATIYPWVEGKWVEKPSLAQIESIGFFLGQVARVAPTHCVGWKRENPRGWRWFQETTNKLLSVLDPEIKWILADEMKAQMDFWPSAEMSDLPCGPIHADIFRNNVLFDGSGKLASVIDWGFCASGYPLVFDLAIVANDWCLKDGAFDLDEDRVQSLLKGRNEAFPMTNVEQKAWSMALRWAALRFWLSRLHDRCFPRDPNGKSHDPTPFEKILRAHREAEKEATNNSELYQIA